jgi:hypothetical protein
MNFGEGFDNLGANVRGNAVVDRKAKAPTIPAGSGQSTAVLHQGFGAIHVVSWTESVALAYRKRNTIASDRFIFAD